MVATKSEIFKQGRAEDFNKILQRQKKDESDPKFAISDSLQEYQQQLEKSAGYQNQMNFNKVKESGNEIRQQVIDFVVNYSVDMDGLEGLKGMDFDDAKTQQKTTEKTIKEYEGLHKKGIINDEEIIYIRETVGKTNAQLKKVLGLTTKLSLGFRDFKKELKPLKLARRIGLTNVPIIGKRIERAIESEEKAESQALGLKRSLRRKEAKSNIKSGGSPMAGFGLGGPSSAGDKEDLAQRATKDLFGEGETPKGPGFDKETAVEEERESDKQFDTSSGLLERILEESELTNELLGKERKEEGKKERSLLSKLLLPLAALTGLGGILSGSISTLGSTLSNSMGALYQGTRSLLGLKPKTPAVPPHIKNKNLNLKSPRTVPPIVAKDTASKIKTKDLVEKNKKKGINVAGKYAKNIVRAGTRFAIPVAAMMGIFDAAKGVANAGELLDKDDQDLTLRDKASAGFAGFLSGLTFGLVDEKKMAKKLASKNTNVDQLTSTELNSRQNLYSDHPMSKLKKVEEIKVDKIEKISTSDGAKSQTTIIKQGDTVNQENKTVFDGATIGTSVPDGKMYHDIP